MVGLVESEGVAARLRIPDRGASEAVDTTDEVEDLRLCLDLTSGAVGVEPDLSLIRPGSVCRILLICSSSGIDGETGDLTTFVGEAGIVGNFVSRLRSLSGPEFDIVKDSSLVRLPRRFFIAKFKGGLDMWFMLARTEGDSSPGSR